ncbi:MAG: TIR domain-containing protein [Bryobacteraceae bacterium]
MMDDAVLKLLRRALDKGQEIEIDGLGTFRRDAENGYEFMPESRLNVFIAYVEEDLVHARRLRDALTDAGYAPWLDKDQLLAGQNWTRAIERAIDLSDAFIACMSSRSLSKRGQFQSELRYALDCANRMPLEETFLLPTRFDACAVPMQIARQVQYVDLFPDFDRGFRQLLRSLRKRKPRLQAPVHLELA